MSQYSILDCKAVGTTQLIVIPGASNFTIIPMLKAQSGLWIEPVGLSGGLEIAGGGISVAPSNNTNGNIPVLRANTAGFPIPGNVITQFTGSPYLWLSCTATLTINVMFLLNDAYGM